MKFSIYHPLLIAIAMIWGFNVVAIKYLVHVFPPMTMTSFRILVAGAVILLFLQLCGSRIIVQSKQFLQIFIIALFGVVGHHTFLALGLHQTSASNGAIIMGLIPLVTSLFSVLFLHVRLTCSKLIGFLIGFIGVVFIILKHPENLSIQLGDLYLFLCVLSQGISFVLLKKAMHSLSPAIVTGWMFTLGSLGLFLISFITEPSGFNHLIINNITAYLVFLASAILSTAIGHFLYNKAMQKVGSIDAAIFINLSPFFALVGSSFLLEETIYWSQIVGFFCVVVGVILGIGRTDKKRSATPIKTTSPQANNLTKKAGSL